MIYLPESIAGMMGTYPCLIAVDIHIPSFIIPCGIQNL